ncbi:MAG: transglutaminase family protein, partial [Lentisphaeraceae bacterium]|nr:transglutaminase family protein [Lentisphaeraceae bacterium]
MSIRVSLKHETTYKYSKAISLGPQLVRLRPAAHCRTPILSYSLDITPAKHFINWQQDPYGNWIARIVFPEKTESFTLKVGLIADIEVINPFDFFVDDDGRDFPFDYPDWLKTSLAPYLVKQSHGKLFDQLVKKFINVKKDTVNFVVELNAYLQSQLNYLIRMDAGVQTPEETLEKVSGSCRDFAWLQVQLLRHLGLASRFVSGYSIQLKPDAKSIDGPSGVNEDITDLHAWAEVYLPGAGWLGLDATSGMVAGEGYIPLSCTSEPFNAAPVSGSLEGGCEIDMDVSMEVLRVNEKPRSTKPYSDDVWQQIVAAGEVVDEKLEEMNVRLTMGGEPTFVSIDDMEGAEWNVAAVGEDKFRISKKLLKQLADRFAPSGLLHYGQGKWCPGEELPRWSLGVFWRLDGEPLWYNQDLFANTEESLNYTIEDARKLLAEIVDSL